MFESMVDIKGFEGKYAVTKSGKVWSYEKRWKCGKPEIEFIRKGKWLKGRKIGGGYIRYSPKINGINFNWLGHRMVAEAFIPNPLKLPCVNHIDCDPSNNFIENLEWCTYKQNSAHMINLGRSIKGEAHHNAVLKDKLVIEIRSRKKKGASLNQLARDYNVSKKTILNVVHRKIWKHL